MLTAHHRWLDGLDEVPAARRGEIKRWIERELRKRKDDCFVVTCRYAGCKGDARLDADFLEMHLRPLDADQAREFIARWFELVECDGAADATRARADAQKKSAALLERLRDKDFRARRVFSMTRNPLLLTAICLVQYNRGQLPRRRVHGQAGERRTEGTPKGTARRCRRARPAGGRRLPDLVHRGVASTPGHRPEPPTETEPHVPTHGFS